MKKLIIAIALAFVSTFAVARGCGPCGPCGPGPGMFCGPGGLPPGCRPCGPGWGPGWRPCGPCGPGWGWGRGGCHFWPGFVGGVVGGLIGGACARPYYCRPAVVAQPSVIVQPAPVVVQQPVVVRPPVVTTIAAPVGCVRTSGFVEIPPSLGWNGNGQPVQMIANPTAVAPRVVVY